MGGQQHRAVLGSIQDQLPHLHHLQGIQTAARLVQDQQRGRPQQCLSQTHALTVALRQCPTQAAAVLRQSGAADDPLHLFLDGLACNALQARTIGQVFPDGQVRVKRRGFWEISHQTACLKRSRLHIMSTNARPALAGSQVAGEDVHQRGFARAVAAHQGDDLLGPGGKAEIAQSQSAAVAPAEVLDVKHGHYSPYCGGTAAASRPSSA